MRAFCDYHIHSSLSLDGISALMEQVRASRAAGVAKICFTEHIDLDMPGGDFTVDFAEYARQIAEARAAFPGMFIGIGLELGDTTGTRERVVALSNALPLDYKLLSRHLVGGIDPYDADAFFAHRTRAQAAQEYLEAVWRSVVSFPDYDALAHLGYVFKFVQGKGFPPRGRADAPDVLEAILRHLVQNGKALEVNTSRWNAFGEGMPGREILRRYRELGGELVTLGSDAHETGKVAQGFPQAAEQLKDLGFPYLATFEARRLVMEKL